MSRYLVRFTPMEPYFFGNERSLNYPGSVSQYQNLYFVRSENVPLQTTLLGTLRFLLLQMHDRHPNDFSKLSPEQQLLIGAESFQPEKNNSFGKIISISPIFLTHKVEDQEKDQFEHFVPLPLDHDTANTKKNKNDEALYTPFLYYEEIDTLDGKKLYTNEYDVKCGTGSGYMSLKDGRILDNDSLFSASLRVGINRGNPDRGLFKKQHKKLKEGFSFAVYCDMADDELLESLPSIASIGQGRSAFRVEAIPVDKEAGIEAETKAFFQSYLAQEAQRKEPDTKELPNLTKFTRLYCLGDSFVTSQKMDETTGLYDGLLFASTDSREFRSMQTVLVEHGKQLIRQKEPILYHLLRAGSVLLAESDEAADAWMERYKHENAKFIGFNTFVKLSKEETK